LPKGEGEGGCYLRVGPDGTVEGANLNVDDVDGFVKQVQDWSDLMSAQDKKNREKEERDGQA
jgi:hypothetical protein